MELYTEYRRKEILFRGHPCYFKKKSWYDWVMIRYEKENERVNYSQTPHGDENVNYGDDDNKENIKKYDYAPGKILGFLKEDENNIEAIVMSCGFQHEKSSVFSNKWKLAYKDEENQIPEVLLVDVDSIVRKCLMIPTNEEMTVFQEIYDLPRWADNFLGSKK